MFYYLIVAIVILLFYISEKAGSKIWAFAAILLLAFVGAFRDDTIGVDVMVYGQKYFETAVSSTSFKEYSLLIKTEPLFLILNFLISRLTKEYYWMQFACQLLTILPVYFCSLYWKQKYSLVLCFIIYLLLFHFQSYNNIKQYIALSFCLCAYTALLLDKKKLYILFTAIAITAHLTSVISILFALLFYVHKIKSPKKIILIDTAVLVFLIGFLFIFKDVLSIMLSNGLDDRYTFYLDNQNNSAVLDKAKILTWLISIVLLIEEKRMWVYYYDCNIRLYFGFFGLHNAICQQVISLFPVLLYYRYTICFVYHIIHIFKEKSFGIIIHIIAINKLLLPVYI